MRDGFEKYKKEIAILLLVLIFSFSILSVISVSFISLLSQLQLPTQISPPTEWRTLYSTTESTGHWIDVESVAVGAVNNTIFFRFRWQIGFPENVSEGDPREDRFWRQDRVILIDWVIQEDNYSLEVVATPPQPETGDVYLFPTLQSSVSPRFRIVYESSNLTVGVLGLQLLSYQEYPLFGRSTLSIPWEESESFVIYQGLVDRRHYSTPLNTRLSEIPVVSNSLTIDGQADDWQGTDQLIWNLTAFRSQAPNPLHSISLVRSNIGIHMLLKFQRSYLTYLQDFLPDYVLSLQELADLIAMIESKEYHDYNFNVLTSKSRDDFTAEIIHFSDWGAETLSVSSTDFAVNQSIELTYRSSIISDFWESEEDWKIGVTIGRSVWLYKLIG
ncbi:MAG: hypothetical protein ACFFDI_17780 [Promethearchaeota archaeon]